MNPSLLTPFRESRCPDWICPVCGGNTLAIKEGTFHAGQTAESSKIWVTPEFGLPDMEFVFVCLLFCERTRCPAVVAVTGTGVLPDSDRARPAAEDITGNIIYRVASFTPALSAFAIPAGCPEEVALPLRQSFSLFISAPSSAATAIRIALEALMEALKLPEARSLHKRLEKLRDEAEYAEHMDALMALKWLGNAGSHELDRVSSQDIEDAYQIIESVLDKIYAGSKESLDALIARMTRVFAPKK
ncbi:DUF4145 domain-containing protein [Salmonella enterica]|uniref:DUF4145 domain-containing protein n=2 Tax=Salmonella enterica I TaxID=59201 RepID=A0A3U9SY23_SALET|nr:DUF4145 domain-containing protein [Salmonella enterica]EAA1342923.1 DUF4145 domain-containing protein [Salmonella enterica subsp. enterica serovar Java]EAA6244769.1 DUF4145 domain-containing protein [Salmonella enterica subsp. enterica serovar Kentucky]EAA7609344.1 DUF4145 domain-containing protein [Salmonella enterica subsp. enterica serovar Newport]EBH9707715.1 DUF4145 domain-containing protein [Salmonella enterica subsp. enterica serovar 4,[5],12:i:-]EBZ2291115.1 DUF4145 domain-containin